MNPEGGDSTSIPADQETGKPIKVLFDQELEPSPQFIAKVRRRIYRRTTASQFASFSWNLPKMILMEMASLIGHLAKALGTNKESKR
jgi:N-glycosylase/DNA lyase